MSTLPLSECQLFASFEGDWPDLPLSAFASKMGTDTRFAPLGVPDGWLAGTISPMAYFVLGDGAENVQDDVFWVLTPIAYGCIAPPGKYPGWDALNARFLSGAHELDGCLGGRRIKALHVRYIDEFNASHGNLPNDVLHWPHVDAQPCAQSSLIDIKTLADARTIHARTDFVLLNSEATAEPLESKIIARFTTTASWFAEQESLVRLSAQHALDETMSALHATSKAMLWQYLKEPFRSSAKPALFDAEEIERFSQVDASKALDTL